MSELDTELTEIFRDEAAGRLDQMDMALLAVEAGDAGAESVDSLFRSAHTIKGAAGMLGLDDIRALAHAVEDVLAKVRETGIFPPELAAPLLRATTALRAQVAGAGEPIDDLLEDLAASLAMPWVGDARTPTADVPRARPAEPAPAGVSPAGVSPAGVSPAGVSPAGVSPAGLSPAGLSPAEPAPAGVSPAGVSSAGVSPAGLSPAEPTPEPGWRAGLSPAEPTAAEPGWPAADVHQTAPEDRRLKAERRPLRVSAEKIDHLLDVVGEVMQYRSRLAHSLGAQAPMSQDLADVLSGSERMLDELKETAIGMRTLPLAVITRRLPRAVRDLARTAGKDVELVVAGADTEIDRVILESLYDPLTHLLRNSITHGIESAAERERARKPARGRLEVRVLPRGSLVEIVVADDGRGVTPEVVEEARRVGSVADVLARSGYSTAAEVTDLAGRGVGLDAVKSYAKSLRGTLEIRSEPGRGMEVVLLLPLALALLDVLLFERGDAVYGVPLVVVEQVVTVAHTLTLEGRSAQEVRGGALPVGDVAVLVGAAAPPLGDRPPALVIRAGGRRAIVTCDAILREQEVMVKPLGPLFGGVKEYLGAAILGDGRIALLVEPTVLTSGSRHARAATEPPGPGPAPAPKVLVVEDSFTVRELQRSILEAAGYPVVTARDGRDALRALERDARIALVVTDLEMPELDGLELTRAIRADPVRSSLPVVIVTSRGSDDDRRNGVEAGADAYMAKQSFDQQALLATVERLVGR